MGQETGIAWTDGTANFWWGCQRVSPGCERCYAEQLAHRFSGAGKPYEGLTRARVKGGPVWTGDVRVVPEALRFLSIEPLLEDLGALDLRGIGWVIVGGESGPGARDCDVAAVRSVVRQCQAAKVPVFVKQLGRRPLLDGKRLRLLTEDERPDRKGKTLARWPEDLQVREFPAGVAHA